MSQQALFDPPRRRPARRRKKPPPPPPKVPTRTTCPTCQAPVVLARVDVIEGSWRLYDAGRLTALGQLQAVQAGALVVTLYHPREWPALRGAWDMASLHPVETTSVLAEHRCSVRWDTGPAALPDPPPRRRRRTDDNPPF